MLRVIPRPRYLAQQPKKNATKSFFYHLKWILFWNWFFFRKNCFNMAKKKKFFLHFWGLIVENQYDRVTQLAHQPPKKGAKSYFCLFWSKSSQKSSIIKQNFLEITKKRFCIIFEGLQWKILLPRVLKFSTRPRDDLLTKNFHKKLFLSVKNYAGHSPSRGHCPIFLISW